MFMFDETEEDELKEQPCHRITRIAAFAVNKLPVAIFNVTCEDGTHQKTMSIRWTLMHRADQSHQPSSELDH